MTSKFTALAKVALLGLWLCSASPAATAQQSEVKGMVTDGAGAGVVGASVVFTRGGQNVTVRTDSYGAYLASLPPGTYEMSVRASGFYEMERAAFNLSEGSEAEFDFELLVAVISDPAFLNRGEPLQPRNLTFHDPYNYQEQRLSALVTHLRPVVLFGGREAQDDSITYTGLFRDGKHLPVIYTYDLLTVKSQTLTYFPKDGSIRATGAVIFKDGEHTQHGSKIEVSFLNGKAQVRVSE